MSFVDAPACIRFIVQALSLEATVACKPKLPFDIAFMISKGHESGITLVVAQEAVVNLKLEVGSVGEQVTVKGGQPLIFTASAYSPSAGVIQDPPTNPRPIHFDLLLTSIIPPCLSA